MEQITIASVAESCRNDFTALLHSDALRMQADKAGLREAVEEEQARFMVWAAHIGIFATYHSSLDYRLRESETVRLLVISELKVLRKAEVRLSGLLPPGAHSPYEDEHVNTASTSLPRPKNPSLGSEFSSDYDALTENECLISIRSAIGRLDRLSRAIEDPGIVSEASKANHFNLMDELGNDAIKVFEEHSLQMIQKSFCGAADFLHHRLSKANASRRRLFLFRREHPDVLYGQRNISPERSLLRSETQKNNLGMPKVGPAVLPSVSMHSKSRTDANSQVQISIAKSTTFVESQFKSHTASETVSSIREISVADMYGQSRWPPPPNISKTRTEFQCPYCCLLLPTKILTKTLWSTPNAVLAASFQNLLRRHNYFSQQLTMIRQHLKKDLEPYVCVFEDCSQPESRFRDEDAWIAHLRSHVMRWSCRLPGHLKGRSTIVFTSGDEYAAHLKEHVTRGKSFSDAQIQLLKRRRGLPDPTPIRTCPLCQITFEDISQAHKQETTYSVFESTTTPSLSALASKMREHVASHLIVIASYSLPWRDDSDSGIASMAMETTAAIFNFTPGLKSVDLDCAMPLQTSAWNSYLRKKGLIPNRLEEMDWSGRGQHAEFKATEEKDIPLTLEKTLGYGASAIVESVRCGRIYLARKTVKLSRYLKREEVMKEVEHLQRLRHPHIVRVVGTYTLPWRLSILLYPVADLTLDHFLESLQDELAPEQRSLRLYSVSIFLRCLAKALSYIHEKAMKHMDIKPKNLLVRSMRNSTLCNQGQFKIYIADFGIARAYRSVEDCNTGSRTEFTKMYAAPEVVAQEQRDQKADIFSLGAVYVEMLAVLANEGYDTPNLDVVANIRESNCEDQSYQANATKIQRWLRGLSITTHGFELESNISHITELVALMLSINPTDRPTAATIVSNIPFLASCCDANDGSEPIEEAYRPAS